jgi:hypothetical protein
MSHKDIAMKLLSKDDENGLTKRPVWEVCPSIALGSETSVQFQIPTESSKQTILARVLADLVCATGDCWVEITYWHADDDANQDLFYGYRLAHGDRRRLHEAALYKFLPDDINEFVSIVSMILYFSWDARMVDAAQSCVINLSHDQLLSCVVQSSSILEPFLVRFSQLGMSTE